MRKGLFFDIFNTFTKSTTSYSLLRLLLMRRKFWEHLNYSLPPNKYKYKVRLWQIMYYQRDLKDTYRSRLFTYMGKICLYGYKNLCLFVMKPALACQTQTLISGLQMTCECGDIGIFKLLLLECQKRNILGYVISGYFLEFFFESLKFENIVLARLIFQKVEQDIKFEYKFELIRKIRYYNSINVSVDTAFEIFIDVCPRRFKIMYPELLEEFSNENNITNKLLAYQEIIENL